MDKPFQNYAELLKKLREDKGLSVPNEERVIELLKKHSYFSLVCGYKQLFKQRESDQYRDGVTIEDLLALFEFDNALRDIFLYSILIIENHIKSLLTYAFVTEYGAAQEAYLTPENFAFICRRNKDTYQRCADVKRLIYGFEQKLQPPYKPAYIQHQMENHGNIPLWVMIKVVTLGTTSKMYSLCKREVQEAVRAEFPGVSVKQLAGMLDLLTRVRNVCAHNERLYDFDPGRNRAIRAMPLHNQLGIGRRKSYYTKGQRDLFAAVVCFKYLLSPDEFREFADRVDAEINKLLKRTKYIPKSKILCCMGFPTNWHDSVNL